MGRPSQVWRAVHGRRVGAFSTLAHAGVVAKSFETCRRRQDLTFSHHVEVVGVPDDVPSFIISLTGSGGPRGHSLIWSILPLPEKRYGTVKAPDLTRSDSARTAGHQRTSDHA